MNSHPNRIVSIKYYDAGTNSYVEHEGEVIRSGAGYTSGPEYGVLYRLTDGRFLGGVRHTDRGDLMTEVRYARTQKDAMPQSLALTIRRSGKKGLGPFLLSKSYTGVEHEFGAPESDFSRASHYS